jgi:hypothetical protein
LRPGTDRATIVILATRLAAARADAEGYRCFSELAGAQPGDALPLALAGFFQARLGEDVGAALAKLDQAAARQVTRIHGQGHPGLSALRGTADPRWSQLPACRFGNFGVSPI